MSGKNFTAPGRPMWWSILATHANGSTTFLPEGLSHLRVRAGTWYEAKQLAMAALRQEGIETDSPVLLMLEDG